MAYSYDRRVATEKVEVEVEFHETVRDAWATTITILDGYDMVVWTKYHGSLTADGVAETEQELKDLKRKIESGADLDSHLHGLGFRFDPDSAAGSLVDKRFQRIKERDSAEIKVLKTWFKTWIVEFVEHTYDNYRADGRRGKEPCVTASYVRDFILEAGAAPRDMTVIFKKLDNKKQLALCSYVLQQAKAQGKLQSSEGLDWNGRPAKCYELA